MNLEQALKQEYAYLKIQNFLINHSYIFSDSEFKVIMALYSMLDYQFRITFIPVSQTELLRKTGKQRQRIYAILEQLEEKGLIRKISGKYKKELSLKLREQFFNSNQRPLRSYNEKNVYDLKPFLELVVILMQIKQKFDDRLFFEITLNAVKRKEKFLSVKIFKEFEEQGFKDEIAILLSSDSNILSSDSNILSSDSNILSSDSNILSSDSNILRIPVEVSIPNNTHTHTQTGDIDDEDKKESIGYEGKEKDVEKVAPATTKGSNSKELLDRFKEKLDIYIKDKLLEEQEKGNIKNANAVFKTLTSDDVELYAKELLKEMKSNVLNKYQVFECSLYDYKRIFKNANLNEDNIYVNKVENKIYLLNKKEVVSKLRKIFENNKAIYEIHDISNFKKMFEKLLKEKVLKQFVEIEKNIKNLSPS